MNVTTQVESSCGGAGAKPLQQKPRDIPKSLLPEARRLYSIMFFALVYHNAIV